MFICGNYAHDDDEIYLISFLRGAFTTRCIAQFIHNIRLLINIGLLYLPDLFSL